MTWLTGCGILVFTWILWTCVAFYRNYQLALSTRLPIVLSPVGTLTIPWLLLYKLTPVLQYLHQLPDFLFKWTKYTYVGWQYDDGGRVHQELGSAFVLCSPGLNEVFIADSDAAHSCLTRRKEFTKPPMMYEPLNIFGHNLDAVEGETWQRHRRLTAPSFNEKVSLSVWLEAIRQAGQALTEWKKEGGETRNVVDDTATVALHVLTNAGLGIQYAFNDAGTKIVSPHQLTYRDALIMILRNFTFLTVLPMNLMSFWFMPAKMQRIGQACREFKLYMSEMVSQERQALIEHREEKANLLSAMVRASERDAGKDAESKSNYGLTDDEIFGNLFIYNMAGHETTANTVATAIAYLAANPDRQEWLSQQIVQILGERSEPADWAYEASFSKLARCMAVMYETLRLHGSIVFIPKECGPESRSLSIAGHTHVLPAGTWVTVNTHAIHCDPKIYANPQEWKPERWIRNAAGGSEELFEPATGSFLPWADGPRVCPGRKFAQVEFVAVMATLFQGHRVSVSPRKGESDAESIKRLQATIDDSAIMAITLQMKQPQDIALTWTKRE